MKKKFLSAFLLGALTLAATSTMTSCKDYDDDISGLKKEIASLEDLVKTKEQTINSSIANLEAAINKANGEHATKAALEEAKKALQAAIDKNYSTLVEKDAELSAAIVKAQAAADAASALATENKAAIEKVAADLATANEKLGTLSDKLEKAIAETAELKAALAAQKAALEEAKTAITESEKTTVEAAKAAVADLNKEVAAADAALAQKIAEEGAAVAKEFDAVKGTIDELQVAHNNLAAEVGALSTKVNGLETKISNVTTLVNKVDAKYDVLTKVLAKALRSLVFEPELYVDGIESIEYPILFQWSKVAKKLDPMTRTRDGITDNLSNIDDYVGDGGNLQAYGPVWGVSYHMNPSRANIEFADVRGFLDREVEVVSRADEGLNIVAAEKDAAGNTVFSCKNGVVTTGIQVTNPENLLWTEGFESVDFRNFGIVDGQKVFDVIKYRHDHVVALQVNSANGTAQDTLITSDYAMLYPRTVYPAYLKWNNGDLEVSGAILYDDPKAALSNHAPVEIAWNDEEGVNLEKLISTVAYRQHVKPGYTDYNVVWSNEKQKRWGLHYEFETVEYKSGANQTIDSKYCKLDKYTGNIVARNVGNDGNTLESQSIASVGREPLVRVLLMLNDTPILDGYILVKIVEKPADVPAKEDKTIEDYTTLDWKVDFNGNSYETPQTTWAQFNEWVLTNGLASTMEDFNRQYVIDGTYAGSVLATATDDTSIYACKVYAEPKEDAAKFDAKVLYIKDPNNINNCAFRAEMTASQIEKYTHENLDPTNLVFYVRFKEVPETDAKYANLWVKFDIDVTRNQIKSYISEKNSNYWVAIDGNDNGWDAIPFNFPYPQSGKVPTEWTNNIFNTFIQNKVVVADENVTATKFFFLPINTEIVDQDGTKWTITTKSSATDVKWNQLICKYIESDVHEWPTIMGLDGEAQTDVTKMAEILKSCATDYNNGAFVRNTLYATDGVTYTKIAEMDQETGVITLNRAAADYNQPLDMIVNAIGYEENHANINTEFHAITGIVGSNSYGIAVDLYSVPAEAGDTKSHAIWTSSWMRPINLNSLESRVVEDANPDGSYVDILSLLSFYDWRGPVAGSMEGNNKWLWAYYNINKIIIDTDPNHVTTDMAGGVLGKTKLSERSNINLCAATAKNAGALQPAGQTAFSFDLTPWNKASLNSAFKTWLGINESKFGYIFYKNNGSNVEDFTVRIPIDIVYEWGHFTTTVDVLIKRTQGN